MVGPGGSRYASKTSELRFASRGGGSRDNPNHTLTEGGQELDEQSTPLNAERSPPTTHFRGVFSSEIRYTTSEFRYKTSELSSGRAHSTARTLIPTHHSFQLLFKSNPVRLERSLQHGCAAPAHAGGVREVVQREATGVVGEDAAQRGVPDCASVARARRKTRVRVMQTHAAACRADCSCHVIHIQHILTPGGTPGIPGVYRVRRQPMTW